MQQPIFALIDCNNFFVSCERLFRPDLQGKPVIVLSSNDGCAVARSNEAKALGIPMGAPAYRYRQLLEREKVVQFSANFELYGDISTRLTRLLTSVTPHIEVYSVDESFLDLSELGVTDYRAWGEHIRQRIWREIGVPVSIGIATSKTLAKLASERAKKDQLLQGVLSFMQVADWLIDAQLDAVPVKDVWGIGWRLSPKLQAEGVHTALQLKHFSRAHAGQLMGVHGRQLVSELNGVACLPLERHHKVRKSVMHGRLFGADTSDFSVIEAAITSLSARATRRLRHDQLLAKRARLLVATNRHKPGYRRTEVLLQLSTPTADAGIIASQLLRGFSEQFNPLAAYHRADVLLYDLISSQALQTDLLGYVDLAADQRSQARQAALDSISTRFGKDQIGYAAEKLSRAWEPKHNLRSPRYTTNWDELPTVRIRQL